ncbi:MAG: sugar ABC transporter ATP-binding protein [Acidobacteriaceae bacterium]|nr:sugar ABC transporter ATP-binding protein [Acidobacteriaceae bacterium]
MQDLLRAENISKTYGGVFALNKASLTLRPGEVHALVGENGAGKSTLIMILAGSAKPDSGHIFIEGRPADIHNPLDSQRLGVAIIYQELDLFPNLTVAENIVIRNLNFPEGPFVSARKLEAFCRPFLEQVGYDGSLRAIAGRLPIGQLQLIALARALSMTARVILMDEPTSSLAGDGVERLLGLIRKLREQGTAIVYVSHKMDEIFAICDRATVLRDGETIGVQEIRTTSPETLIRMMVGRDLEKRSRSASQVTSEVILSVSGLTTEKLSNVSFEVHRGEVLGIAGLVGAGRSELGAALFGLDKLKAGEIRLHGRKFECRSPAQAIDRGIGLVPEDRKIQGLMPQMSVLENGTIAVIRRMQRFGFVQRDQELEAVAPLFRALNMKSASMRIPVKALSGGNQQKALLARWLLIDPDLLFLDDPARGIDVGAKQDIYQVIAELAAKGKGLILVSSELPELLNCSDRILVLSNGRVTGMFDAAEATQESIMASAVGMRPGDRQ